ncbi:MAG TPA: discoidin domain-containing protein [Tepidisphaeraceae bacterium]|nr:discoidin domain-containing protein [Tepidisphaeraceae bacterium]
MSKCFPRLPALLITLLLAPASGAEATSEWVHPGPDGKLEYKATHAGDRIMDFSYAGYMGGGVALPDVPVKRSVEPSSDKDADDTARIQAAIDDVAKLALAGGFRGAVLLAPGTYNCASPITITASGVVLRGSGAAGPSASTINLTGNPHLAIAVRLGGNGGLRGAPRDATTRETIIAETSIAEAYVPSGAMSLNVRDASSFRVGDAVSIRKPVTPQWVHFMQMDDLVRDGKHQTWIKTGTVLSTERHVAAIAANRITLDVPLSDSIDERFTEPSGGRVARIKPVPRITQAGVENLHIQSPPQAINHTQAHFQALRISGEDCWARDLVIDETMNSVGVNGARLTLQRITVNRKAKHLGASKPAEFAPNGTQVLLDRCNVNADNVWFAATGAQVPGPIVLLNCTFHGNGRAESHQRWSTGMLYDNCRAPEGGIDVRNRGSMGSGHGWPMGWGVLWNCTAKSFLVQNPPGALNWLIGCVGESTQSPRPFGSAPLLPGGVVDSMNAPVTPRSLYLTQLAERLGPQAVRNLGYSSPADVTVADESPRSASDDQTASDELLGQNLALHRPAYTSNVRGNSPEFAGENALDADPNTIWMTDDNAARATLELDMEGGKAINACRIIEARGQRIEEYKIEAQVDSDWRLLAHGTTIEPGHVDRFPKVLAWKVRLTIMNAKQPPAISTFGLYLDKVSPPDQFKAPPPVTEKSEPVKGAPEER